jgi:hypothetical protein
MTLNKYTLQYINNVLFILIQSPCLVRYSIRHIQCAGSPCTDRLALIGLYSKIYKYARNIF